MNTLKILYLTLTFFCALFFSCKHDPELVPSAKIVCFDNQISPIILSNCATSGCHDGNGEPFSLQDYGKIFDHVKPYYPLQSPIYKAITANPHLWNIMPPKPNKPLNSAQIDFIEIWILQGAGLQVSGNDSTSCNLGCDSTNVTFSRTIKPIHDLYCVSCHSGSQPSGGIMLIDYISITSAMSRDKYFKSIKHETGAVPMPQGSSKLDDCTIAEIRKWYSAGMQNN